MEVRFQATGSGSFQYNEDIVADAAVGMAVLHAHLKEPANKGEFWAHTTGAFFAAVLSLRPQALLESDLVGNPPEQGSERKKSVSPEPLLPDLRVAADAARSRHALATVIQNYDDDVVGDGVGIDDGPHARRAAILSRACRAVVPDSCLDHHVSVPNHVLHSEHATPGSLFVGVGYIPAGGRTCGEHGEDTTDMSANVLAEQDVPACVFEVTKSFDIYLASVGAFAEPLRAAGDLPTVLKRVVGVAAGGVDPSRQAILHMPVWQKVRGRRELAGGSSVVGGAANDDFDVFVQMADVNTNTTQFSHLLDGSAAQSEENGDSSRRSVAEPFFSIWQRRRGSGSSGTLLQDFAMFLHFPGGHAFRLLHDAGEDSAVVSAVAGTSSAGVATGGSVHASMFLPPLQSSIRAGGTAAAPTEIKSFATHSAQLLALLTATVAPELTGARLSLPEQVLLENGEKYAAEIADATEKLAVLDANIAGVEGDLAALPAVAVPASFHYPQTASARSQLEFKKQRILDEKKTLEEGVKKNSEGLDKLQKEHNDGQPFSSRAAMMQRALRRRSVVLERVQSFRTAGSPLCAETHQDGGQKDRQHDACTPQLLLLNSAQLLGVGKGRFVPDLVLFNYDQALPSWHLQWHPVSGFHPRGFPGLGNLTNSTNLRLVWPEHLLPEPREDENAFFTREFESPGAWADDRTFSIHPFKNKAMALFGGSKKDTSTMLPCVFFEKLEEAIPGGVTSQGIVRAECPILLESAADRPALGVKETKWLAFAKVPSLRGNASLGEQDWIVDGDWLSFTENIKDGWKVSSDGAHRTSSATVSEVSSATGSSADSPPREDATSSSPGISSPSPLDASDDVSLGGSAPPVLSSSSPSLSVARDNPPFAPLHPIYTGWRLLARKDFLSGSDGSGSPVLPGALAALEENDSGILVEKDGKVVLLAPLLPELWKRSRWDIHAPHSWLRALEPNVVRTGTEQSTFTALHQAGLGHLDRPPSVFFGAAAMLSGRRFADVFPVQMTSYAVVPAIGGDVGTSSVDEDSGEGHGTSVGMVFQLQPQSLLSKVFAVVKGLTDAWSSFGSDAQLLAKPLDILRSLRWDSSWVASAVGSGGRRGICGTLGLAREELQVGFSRPVEPYRTLFKLFPQEIPA